jgi:uncharacterized protein YcfJ
MKSLFFASLGVVLTLSVASVWAQTNFEYAPVVDSRPIYQVVEVSAPQQQCWEEEVVRDQYRDNPNTGTPVLLSTLIGGAIGNSIGHNKSNQRVGAVVGALLGRSIGRDIVRQSNQSQSLEYEVIQRCNTVYQQREEERLMGYQVTYLYNGEEFSVRTDTDPGEQIRIRVSVEAVL